MEVGLSWDLLPFLSLQIRQNKSRISNYTTDLSTSVQTVRRLIIREFLHVSNFVPSHVFNFEYRTQIL
jgi:hypothetical protein